MEQVTLAIWVISCALLAWVDFRTKKLPNRALAWGTATTFSAAIIMTFLSGDWPKLIGAVLISLTCGTIFFALALLSKNSFGMGDVKFSPLCFLLPALQGLPTALIAVMFSFFTAAVFGLSLIALKRGGLRARIAFGPFMFLSAICSLLV